MKNKYTKRKKKVKEKKQRERERERYQLMERLDIERPVAD